jgi:uncharacterized protein (TIGR04255 family)
MIQLQNGWFVYNWRKTPKCSDYPRYSNVRREFDQALEAYRKCAIEKSWGELRPNLWEVTYINRVEKGALWQSPSDWWRVFPGLVADPFESGIGTPESFGGVWAFRIRENLGRLHVELRHQKPSGSTGSTSAPGQSSEVLYLRLTARGPLASETGWEELGSRLDIGRETIVMLFDRISSPQAHAAWGRQS